jgi:hypothetical protein
VPEAASEGEIRRSRGRPRLPEPVRGRRQLMVRFANGLRDYIAERAAKSARSQSEEVERIVEKARGIEAKWGDAAALESALAVMDVFLRAGNTASAFKHGRAQPPAEWLRDPYAYDQAARALVRVILALRPPGPVEPPPLPRADTIKDPSKRRVAEDLQRVLGGMVGAAVANEEADRIGRLRRDDDDDAGEPRA